MRVRACAVTALFVAVVLWLAIGGNSRGVAQPATSGADGAGSFAEDFSHVDHMDMQNTTAHWDTASATLRLSPTEPVTVHRMGAHDWWLTCPWEKPWSPCPKPAAPAIYVPETGRAYHLADLIAEYDPQRNVAFPMDVSGPALRHDSAAAAYASTVGKVYVFGGCDIGEWQSCIPTKSIYEFDPVARASTLLAVELPYGLNDACAAYVPATNRIYLFGGLTPDRVSADILEFDVSTHSLHVLSTALPTARRNASAAFVAESDRIYLFGGYHTEQIVLDEILAFDPNTLQLSQLETRLPVGLHKAAVAYVPRAERVFIFGGEQPGGRASKLVFAFETDAETVVPTPYTLPGDGMWDAAAIYAPEFDWLAVLGGETFGFWPRHYAGILRLRWSGSTLTQHDSCLPWLTHTSSAVYVPQQNKAYLFGGGKAEILQFDIRTSLMQTMTATLPMTSSNPGVVWVPTEDRAYVFDRSGIYTYDPARDTLATMTSELPTGFDPRVATYASPRNAVYLFDSADADGAVLRYNLADDTLVPLEARLPTPRRGAHAVYVPKANLIFLMGGWGYQSENYLGDILVFDVANETLGKQEGLLMPLPGEYSASAHMPTTGNIFLLGGWGGWSQTFAFPFEQLWHFDTTPPRHIVTHALTLLQPLGYQGIVWASAEDCFYTFGGLRKPPTSVTSYSTDWIYRFECGHVEQGIAQSTRVNADGAAVLRATLHATEQLNGGAVHYFLSNDGGATWDAISPGAEHVFTTQGSDLRWKAELHGDGIRTPTVDEVVIDWLTESPTPTVTLTPSQTATSTVTATPTATATKPVHAIYLPIIMRG